MYVGMLGACECARWCVEGERAAWRVRSPLHAAGASRLAVAGEPEREREVRVVVRARDRCADGDYHYDDHEDGVRLVLLVELAVRVHGYRQVQAERAEELHHVHVHAATRRHGSAHER